MRIYGWKLDEQFSLRGCAPLWAWVPSLEQMELFGGSGMVVAVTECDEGGDGGTAGYASLFY